MMSGLRMLFSAVLLFHSSSAFAQFDPSTVAQYLCRQTQFQPDLEYKKYFSEQFRRQLPEPVVIDLFRDLALDAGICTAVTVEAPLPPSETVFVRMETRSANQIRLKVVLESESSHRIDSLQVEEVSYPSVVIRDLRDLRRELARLPGVTSATIWPEKRAATQIDGDVQQPISGVSKLYVLGSLERAVRSGHARWNELLPIRDTYKSLPSGVMHTWPPGKRATLFEFATQMISIGDNTATDHLIRRIGREKIESELSAMGNSFKDENTPFLLTGELFKIKWALRPEAQRRYLSMRADDRRVWLESQASKIPLTSVRYRPQPLFVREVEWYASTNDMCEAVFELDARRSREVRHILGLSTPGVSVGGDSSWRWAGYMGGSEPGVAALSYLLETQRGERVCVAMAWHNTVYRVSLWRLLDLARKTIRLVERTN